MTTPALAPQPVSYPPILLPEGSFVLELVSALLGKVHPDNNNTHPPKQLKAYIAVLRAGVRQPIVVSRLSDRLVKGHGALQAAQLAGWTHWPVQYQEFATPEAELAYLLADNQIASLSKVDEMTTAGVLARLKAAAPTQPAILKQTGFSTAKITALIASRDPDKPDPVKPAAPLKLTRDPKWTAAAAAAGLSLDEWAVLTLDKASLP